MPVPLVFRRADRRLSTKTLTRWCGAVVSVCAAASAAIAQGTEGQTIKLELAATAKHRLIWDVVAWPIVVLPDTETKFLGAIAANKVRWSLARWQPWLEYAYLQASANIMGGATPPNFVDSNGAIDVEAAKNIVYDFVALLTHRPPPGDPARNWILLGQNMDSEHASWLTAAIIEQVVGSNMWRECVLAGDITYETKALIKCVAPVVAKVNRRGEFIALIDRIAFLDEIVPKLARQSDQSE